MSDRQALDWAIEAFDLSESVQSGFTDLAEKLCRFALNEEEQSGSWEISLVFTTDEHLADLHNEFMGVASPTDIMTFPYDNTGDDPSGGDIIISVAQAERQRVDDKWSLEMELQFLVIHGVLHLCGWDDLSDEDRQLMLTRQRIILDAFQLAPESNR